jgi:predicted chitinase
MLTAADLLLIMPRCPADKAEDYARELAAAMDWAEINTVTRAAAFLAQLAHESGELRWMEELADGSAYEGRKDLGNDYPGDGKRYKGRGPIQLTGRRNYRLAGRALGVDLEANPARAAEPDVAFLVAAWYWMSRNLNLVADSLDFRAVTKAVNGLATDEAPSWHKKRVAYYARALEVLGRQAEVPHWVA